MITIPFRKFRVQFDDHTSVEIIKDYENVGDSETKNIVFNFYKPDSTPASYSLKRVNLRSNRNIFISSASEDVIPDREHIYPLRLMNLSYGRTLEKYE